MEHITLEEYKQLQQKGKSKYKNEKVVIDGIRFDSQKESNRWQELKILQKGGAIKDLRRQIHFQLQPGYKKITNIFKQFIMLPISSIIVLQRRKQL